MKTALNVKAQHRTPSLEEYIVDNFLFNQKIAQERIAKEGTLHNIKELSDLILEPKNFREAYDMYYKEKAIVFEDEYKISEEKLFQGCMYVILAQQQDYITQIEIYNKLFKKGLNTRERILENPEEFQKCLTRSMYKKGKARYITELAKNWDNHNLVERIQKKVRKDKETEQFLRKSLVKEVLGFGEKTASLLLRMCGTKYLVPVDTWMAEMLYLHGYDVEIIRDVKTRENGAHKRRKSQINRKRYTHCEELTLALAEKYTVPGHILQLAFWTKNSSYRNRKYD
jgi:thermostable 8-oxoguanine DNA glycosylase